MHYFLRSLLDSHYRAGRASVAASLIILLHALAVHFEHSSIYFSATSSIITISIIINITRTTIITIVTRSSSDCRSRFRTGTIGLISDVFQWPSSDLFQFCAIGFSIC